MNAQDIIDKLRLIPHTVEGGYYRETYRSEDIIDKPFLSEDYTGSRSVGTAIYYLLTPGTISSLHKLPSDEIFHFYMGDPVEMLQLFPDGSGKMLKIGTNMDNEEYPQIIAPKHCWQGSRLIEGGRFALMGTTVSPGFDFKDYIVPNKEQLMIEFPDFEKEISELIRKE